MEKVTIFIADDHALVRDGYKSIFEDEDMIHFVGEASDGEEAEEKILKLKPDIAILDITMPKKTGLEVVKSLRKRCPKVKTLILSMHKGEAYILQAITNGADGYLVKDTDSDEFLKAIRTIASGEKYFGKNSVDLLLSSYISNVSGEKKGQETIQLSPRELEILGFVAEGLTSQDIARKVHLSKRTVENHRARIMTKMGVKNTTELLGKARSVGLID